MESHEMGCPNKTKNSFFSNLEVSRISDDSIFDLNVLFWDNGKSLIVVAERSCHLYSVATGEHVKELFTMNSRIVACHFHPGKPNLLLALSEEGGFLHYDLRLDEVKNNSNFLFKSQLLNSQKVPKLTTYKMNVMNDCEPYKWEDEVLNVVKNRKFIYGAPQPKGSMQDNLFWTAWCLNEEVQCHISIFCHSGNQYENFRIPLGSYKKCYKNFCVTPTANNRVLFVGMGMNCIHVYHYKEKTLRAYNVVTHFLGDSVDVKSLSLSPKDLSVATADSRNVILVWKNITARHPLKAAYHWHTVDVHDLAFSEESVHLFSGGDENVLVKWSFLSNEKNFLPRLPSAIYRISCAEGFSLVALSLASNEIYIIDSNFAMVSVIKKHSLHLHRNVGRCFNILTSDPRNDHLVLNGTPGHLQFISQEKYFKVLYSLDVGKTNYMTGDKYLINLEVTHAKFSRNGSWLVTAEARRDEFLKDYRLKFWYYDESKQSFTLNTFMELPHDENDIHALEISSDDLVATSGSDKQFKLWAPFETTELNVTRTVWSFLSSGNYKMLPCNPIDFCKDATLIAVGFGPSLTLWNTSSCALKCSLTPPLKRNTLKFIKFGSDEHSHLIVAATDFNITTWNIITLTVAWTVDLEVSYLVSDFFNSYMCVFSKRNTLFVFSPATTSPELVMENVSDSEIIAAHSVFYMTSEKNQYQMYFLNSEQHLFLLKSKDAEMKEFPNEMEDYLTPFATHLTKKSKTSVKKSISEYIPTKSKKDTNYISAILDAPAHTLPNPSRFCSGFLESLTVFLEKQQPEPKRKAADDDVIEILNDVDENKSSDVPVDVLWTTVNELFK